MTENTAKKVRLIYGIVLTVSIIATGLCLMAFSAHIYLTGDHTYSAEKVAAYFSLIAVPVYVVLALIAGRWLIELILPGEKTRKLNQVPAHMLLARSKSRKLDAGPVLLADIAAEEKGREIRRSILIIVTALSFGLFLVYGLNPANFTEDINASVIKGVLVLLICLIIPFVLGLYTIYRNNGSMIKEAQMRKDAQSKESVSPVAKSGTPVFVARMVISLVAVALVVVGLMGEGTVDVLTKAINICTECIGLG